MSLIKHPISIVLVTIADDEDVNTLKDELGKHGKVIGTVFSDNKKLKGGAFLWKHDKVGIDDFFLVIISGRTSVTEALTEEGIKGISKRGLFNLKKFHEDYPGIPMFKLDAIIDASDIADFAKKRILLTEKGRAGNAKKEFLKEREELVKKMEQIGKDLTGGRTRELNLGVITIKDDKDFKQYLDNLKPHTGEKELWAGRFPKEDVGLIVWHHEQEFKDEYWIFLVLDKDTIAEGKFFDWQGPDIKDFKRRYGDTIDIVDIGLVTTNLALDAGKITRTIDELRAKRLGTNKRGKAKA